MGGILDLQGRTALVTGAGQGVGAQIAVRFAEHGAGTVVVNDLFEERAEATCEAVRRAGAKAEPAVFDVSDRGTVQAQVGRIAAEVGPVEILVNNAGIPPDHGSGTFFVESDPDDWQPWFDVNVFGTMTVSHALLPAMLERRWGRIVTIISDAGRVGEPTMVPYGAAKAAAAGFTRSLAKEVGRAGITANCIALGGIKTEAMAEMLSPDMEEKSLKRYAIERLGQPDDVAGMALFLASDAGEWITGQTYPVNGGYSFAM